MSYLVNGIEAKKVGVLLEPSTYDADITPENMQNGMTAYAKGKKVVGTGKAFAVAGYGERAVQSVYDEKGNKKYGFSIFVKTAPNIIFFSPTTTGDIALQTHHVVDLMNDNVNTIGTNYTASGKIYAFQNGNRLIVYFENIEDKETVIKYFYGKDNER